MSSQSLDTVVSDPSLWTIDWVGGSLDASPEFCAHFQRSKRPIFDLASLTKVVATTTLVTEIFDSSSQSFAEFLKTPLQKAIPELAKTPFIDLTLGQVWEHQSGLQAHRLLFSDSRRSCFSATRRSDMWRYFLDVLQKEELSSPAATIYSDLGFILLGCWVERVSGTKSLAELFELWKKKQGLGQKAPHLRFGVALENSSKVPPTESRHRPAEVNDDNCFAMGGVSSHAGLFATVEDLWEFLKVLLDWGNRSSKVADHIFTHRNGIDRFNAGWDTPTTTLGGLNSSQAGKGFAPHTIGHLGFTGTALWWNFHTRRAGVLLSNRVRPADSMQSRSLIRLLRQEFFGEVWQNNSLKGESWKAFLRQPLRAPQ